MVLWNILWEQCYDHYQFCLILIEINRLRKTGFQYKLLVWLLNPQTLLKKWIQWIKMTLWICTNICDAKSIKNHTPTCPMLCNKCWIDIDKCCRCWFWTIISVFGHLFDVSKTWNSMFCSNFVVIQSNVIILSH